MRTFLRLMLSSAAIPSQIKHETPINQLAAMRGLLDLRRRGARGESDMAICEALLQARLDADPESADTVRLVLLGVISVPLASLAAAAAAAAAMRAWCAWPHAHRRPCCVCFMRCNPHGSRTSNEGRRHDRHVR